MARVKRYGSHHMVHSTILFITLTSLAASFIFSHKMTDAFSTMSPYIMAGANGSAFN